ncbi:hypothetical protein Q8A67_001226 [Cirrhinus molitorella]|uniref:Uncharacterized protein n=1 Tax=Cirrhinus molitorella TaxID=172907 RepID=A0AA88TXI9_9TELE|nr:hypothetical protein Q8A67_001226 [Cirrhinus molitorella]
MLLIIQALLLILAALGQDHKAGARKIYPLDMALNSVDDGYDGCTVKMANLVTTKYLEKEINNSTDFKKAWQEEPAENTTSHSAILGPPMGSGNLNVGKEYCSEIRYSRFVGDIYCKNNIPERAEGHWPILGERESLDFPICCAVSWSVM